MNYNSKKTVYLKKQILNDYEFGITKAKPDVLLVRNIKTNKLYAVPKNVFTNPANQAIYNNALPKEIHNFIDKERNMVVRNYFSNKYEQNVNPITSSNKGNLKHEKRNFSHGDTAQRRFLGQDYPKVPPKPTKTVLSSAVKNKGTNIISAITKPSLMGFVQTLLTTGESQAITTADDYTGQDKINYLIADIGELNKPTTSHPYDIGKYNVAKYVTSKYRELLNEDNPEKRYQIINQVNHFINTTPRVNDERWNDFINTLSDRWQLHLERVVETFRERDIELGNYE